MPSAGMKMSSSSRYRNSAKWTLGQRLEARKEEESPGPGKYVPRQDHLPKTSSFSFGTSAKSKDFSETKLPGPGSYTASDPTVLAKSAAFASAARIPKRRERFGPEPGQYMNPKNLSTIETHRGWSWAGRHYQKKYVNPGPGTYKPDDKTIILKDRTAVLDSGPIRDSFGGSASNFAPGPGKYASHGDFGKASSTTRSLPSFSMQSTRRPGARHDESVGPVLSLYSSFG